MSHNFYVKKYSETAKSSMSHNFFLKGTVKNYSETAKTVKRTMHINYFGKVKNSHRTLKNF